MQLNIDLTKIFFGKKQRNYGQLPKKMGNFERISPSKESEKLIKMVGGQKWFNNVKNYKNSNKNSNDKNYNNKNNNKNSNNKNSNKNSYNKNSNNKNNN